MEENQLENLKGEDSPPILIVYTELNLMELPNLQFKLLDENQIGLPKNLEYQIFGKTLDDITEPKIGKGFISY